jgi:hypothetical protein
MSVALTFFRLIRFRSFEHDDRSHEEQRIDKVAFAFASITFSPIEALKLHGEHRTRWRKKRW